MNSDVNGIHATQNQGAAKTLSGKNEFRILNATHVFEDLNGIFGEGDPVFAASFHTLSRNRPHARIEVDLLPSRVNSLARSCGGQDRKLQTPRRNRTTFPKPMNKCYELLHGQSRVMAAR